MSLDPHQLAALAAVDEEGSFEAAARRLHVTPSAVSQRVKALEQQVGQVLVRRSRPCRATAAGQGLVRLAGQWAVLEAEARATLGGEDGGLVRIALAVNADSLSTWFPPVLTALPARVVVEVHREDQDHSAALLRDGTVMAAVTADPEPVQGCRVHALGAMRYRAVASPGYVARWLPDGPTPSALAVAPVLAFNRKDALQDQLLARLGRGPLDPPRHLVPSSHAFLTLVEHGLGWGMVPEGAVADALRAGSLVELAARHPLDVPLHWQHWRLGSRALEALTEHVLATAAGALHPTR
jgi:LysR family transcriptional regulator (chromosome initiation inhibitor)